MTDVYHKVGSTFYDYFIYSTTGLADSDFTKQVDKTGRSIQGRPKHEEDADYGGADGRRAFERLAAAAKRKAFGGLG